VAKICRGTRATFHTMWCQDLQIQNCTIDLKLKNTFSYDILRIITIALKVVPLQLDKFVIPAMFGCKKLI